MLNAFSSACVYVIGCEPSCSRNTDRGTASDDSRLAQTLISIDTAPFTWQCRERRPWQASDLTSDSRDVAAHVFGTADCRRWTGDVKAVQLTIDPLIPKACIIGGKHAGTVM
jgi:hypothetical protein